MGTVREQPRPTFLGIGAHRAATTWLSEVLRSHPSISMAHTKEIHYFSNEHDRGDYWYLKQFSRDAQTRAIGEFSTTYLYTAGTPSRVRAFDPSLKLLVSLRDPVERAYSHFRYLRRYGEGERSFLETVEQRPELVEFGLYHRLLCRWWEHFPDSQFHLVLYDDIACKPGSVARDVFAFLRVPIEHSTDLCHRRVSPSITPRSVALEVLRKRAFRFLVESNLSWVIVRARQFGLAEWYRRQNNRIGAEHSGPSPEERQLLLPRFRDDIARLEARTGLQLEAWRS